MQNNASRHFSLLSNRCGGAGVKPKRGGGNFKEATRVRLQSSREVDNRDFSLFQSCNATSTPARPSLYNCRATVKITSFLRNKLPSGISLRAYTFRSFVKLSSAD